MGEESTLDGEHIPTTVMKWGGLRGLSSLCCSWVSRRDSLIRYVTTGLLTLTTSTLRPQREKTWAN